MEDEEKKQQKEWCEIMETSTNPQELIETAARLEIKPLTIEEAKELAELNQETIALHAEKEKRFTELLREALATDNPAKKEALFAKIVTREFKHVLEGSGTIEF